MRNTIQVSKTQQAKHRCYDTLSDAIIHQCDCQSGAALDLRGLMGVTLGFSPYSFLYELIVSLYHSHKWMSTDLFKFWVISSWLKVSLSLAAWQRRVRNADSPGAP